MSEVKHTPGPWEVSKGFHKNRIADSDDAAIGYALGSNDEAEANARLIAAAPEMLEALYEAEEYFDNRADADNDETGFVPNTEMKLLVSIRAAIAKATGAAK